MLAVLGEALCNMARHAGAEHVWVRVSVGRGLALTVQDDGRGIPPGVVRSGLRNMQERAERLGGTCTFETPDGGRHEDHLDRPRPEQRRRGTKVPGREVERTSRPGPGRPSVGA